MFLKSNPFLCRAGGRLCRCCNDVRQKEKGSGQGGIHDTIELTRPNRKAAIPVRYE